MADFFATSCHRAPVCDYIQRGPLARPDRSGFIRFARGIPRRSGESQATRLSGSRLGVEPDRTYSLAELIDLAEVHNPETRVAWERALAKVAVFGVAWGLRYLVFDFEGAVSSNRRGCSGRPGLQLCL
jgi:hypothetical protein